MEEGGGGAGKPPIVRKAIPLPISVRRRHRLVIREPVARGSSRAK